jgi:hypothetical protein
LLLAVAPITAAAALHWWHSGLQQQQRDSPSKGQRPLLFHCNLQQLTQCGHLRVSRQQLHAYRQSDNFLCQGGVMQLTACSAAAAGVTSATQAIA